jgi:hypothetical protein
MATIREVKVLEGFNVELLFSDGVRKVVDLSRYMKHPVFEPIRKDPGMFRTVYVDKEAGTIVWPNGADMCPDMLYEGLPPA